MRAKRPHRFPFAFFGLRFTFSLRAGCCVDRLRPPGPKDAPTVLLLHGFPTSSHMFRNLIPQLAERYHVLAPDYPGFGASAMPDPKEFEYSFDNFAQIIRGFLETQDVERYSIYLMNYGAPVGFRVAAIQPERVDALLIQNGNAYEEGLREFWNPIKAYWKEKTPENRQVLKDALLTIEATKWQYTHGVHQPEEISPDSWFHDQWWSQQVDATLHRGRRSDAAEEAEAEAEAASLHGSRSD